MTTLAVEPPLFVLINTFTVAPERADELLQVLIDATENVMRHRDGFVSANFHVSHDRRHLANYAQWTSRETFEAMLADPVAQKHMGRAAAIAEHFEPITYALAYAEARPLPGGAVKP